MIELSHYEKILSLLNVERFEPLLLAVSGGVDSMVMADLCTRSLPKDRIAIAHCNFHLRGADSDADEGLVKEFAESRGIIFIKKDFDTKEYAASKGVSIEMAARELRYSWFGEVCRDLGYGAVAVAHNLNDNVETLILNMLRGTGIKGMSGMKAISRLPAPDADAMLLRPMLEFARKDIREYAVLNGIRWREDKTNSDSSYKRNLVRNEIFPLLERLNPSYLDTLSKDIRNISQAENAADAWCNALRKELVSEKPDGSCSINIAKLKAYPAWEYFIFNILNEYGFGSAEVGNLVRLLNSGENVSGRQFLAGEHILAASSKELIISRKQADDFPAFVKIPGPGEYSISGRKFQVEIMEYSENMTLKQPEGTIIMNSDKIGFPLIVRRWRTGDWMCPLGVRNMSGRPGRRKLQDILTDLKFNMFEKENAQVLQAPGEDESHVAAILCIRIDESIKITPATHSVIRITEAKR